VARSIRKALVFLPFILAALWLSAPVDAQDGRRVLVLTVNGAIGPASDDYLGRSLETAVDQGVQLVVIRMDTPGGLDTAMRAMIKDITASPIPIVTYVTPTGARAASAGTYILYASHVAAMTPGTNLGAATPVQMGGGAPDQPADNEGDGEQAPQPSGDSMKQKMVNDAVAYIRGLAELRGRNADWAEKAVREAASLPAHEALEQNVVDIVATGMDDLLKQLHGREVEVLNVTRTLNTEGVTLVEAEPDWRSGLLSVITNPNVAYILMLVGIYGLIFEFSNPGAIVPGTVGAIALLLALYSFQLLPINYAGMALILLGLALMIGEAFAPNFGVLGIGGVIAFVIGSIILMDTRAPGFGIDLSVIGIFAATSALLFMFVISMAFKARGRPVVSGRNQLIGAVGTVVDDFQDKGRVHVHGENWQAHSRVALRKDQRVEITGIDGLTLRVEPLPMSAQEEMS